MIVALLGITAFAQEVTTVVTPTVTQTVTTSVAPVCDEETTATLTKDRIKIGPFLGFSIVPQAGVPMGLNFGGYIGDFNIEAWKFDLTTPLGLWLVGALWTPQIEQFGYRVGLKVLVENVGAIVYRGFGFVMGISNTWGPIQLYADLNILPFGVLVTVPVVGFNILFAELIQ